MQLHGNSEIFGGVGRFLLGILTDLGRWAEDEQLFMQDNRVKSGGKVMWLPGFMMKFIKKPFPLFLSEADRFRPRRYASKLTFDISPYPPREEWDEGFASGLEQSLDFHRHWEKKEFVRGAIAAEEEKWAEMLDLSWWLSPTAGEAYSRGMR